MVQTWKFGVFLLTAAAMHAVASETPLHCCATTERRPMELACEGAPDDAIESISYATWGDRTNQRIVCGDEAASANCTVDVSSVFDAECVGKRLCSVPDTMLGEGCHDDPDWAVVVLRWVCKRDANPQQTEHSLPALPLRTQGNIIVDGNGQRIRLKGVNWSGGQGHKRVVEGLNRAPLRDIARLIREFGFNYVRLPYSTQMAIEDAVVEDHAVAANPELIGKKSLEVYDKVVEALGAQGIMVMIDNHMHDADWCCGNGDCNGLWFSPRYTAEQWVEMWGMMADRYKNVSAVVGASIKNEPRRVCAETDGSWAGACDPSFTGQPLGTNGAWDNCVQAAWSTGPENLQLRKAVSDAGQAVLAKDPDLLISICGLDYGGDLKGVVENPPDLPANQYVYESHEYSWFHNDLMDPDADPADHKAKLDRDWGHVMSQNAAPVIVSEYGFAHNFQECQSEDCDKIRKWYGMAAAYFKEGGPLADVGGLDWAYWQLAATQEGGTGRDEGHIETFGVMNECYTGPASTSHFAAITALMDEPQSPTPPPGGVPMVVVVGGTLAVVAIGVVAYFWTAQPQQSDANEMGTELNS